MEENIHVQAAEYVKLLDELRREAGDVESALAILDQVGKDRRVRMMSARNDPTSGNGLNGYGDNGNDVEATPKQRALLETLGVIAPAALSKAEASRLIDEARAR